MDIALSEQLLQGYGRLAALPLMRYDSGDYKRSQEHTQAALLLCQDAGCAGRFLYRPVLQPTECVAMQHMFKWFKKALAVRLSRLSCEDVFS